MARTVLPIVAASDAGGAIPYATPSVDGSIVPPNALVFVINSSGVTRTVTVQTPTGALAVPAGLELSDRSLSLPASRVAIIGPFPTGFYARPSAPDAGQVYVDYSLNSGMLAAAVQL